MRIEEVNKIFKTKYPYGKIYQKDTTGYVNEKNKILVIFDTREEKLKTYGYYVSSYIELLQRLGFKILHKKDLENIKSRIEEMKKELNDGFINDEFFGKINLSPEELKKRENDIAYYTDKITDVIIID